MQRNRLLLFLSNMISTIGGTNQFKTSNKVHMREAMDWLMLANDSTSDAGVSEAFHLFHGWLPSYPETTGYIIETFFDYSNDNQNDIIKKRAKKMADWLISIQHENGSFPDSYFKKEMVFDTGQILFGLVRAYENTKQSKYKEAAIRAGNWLISEQEKDGTWIKNAYNKIPHTYYSRVAWSLLDLHKITSEDKYVIACMNNINWALSCQSDNGWFKNASFTLQNHNNPFTHTIAYTIRGILESGIYLSDKRFINSAVKAMDNLMIMIPSDGFICGTYDKNGKGNKKYSCLTGSAQLSIIFLKLYKLTQDYKYLNKGRQINNYLKTKQNIKTNNRNIRGAIAGSYPIWGKYIHFSYPNWATKFFIDALLLEDSLER